MTKRMFMLIGVPASGKSTFRDRTLHRNDWVTVSTDDLIEEAAKLRGGTYDSVFVDVIDVCTKIAKQKFYDATREGVPIIIDRTNLTPKSRAEWIKHAKRHGYEIVAVEFALPSTDAQHEQWNQRLVRPGKSIPRHVLADMFRNYTPASLDEGFDFITCVNTWKGS